MKALLLGATGLVGKETLAQLSADTRFEKVLVLARKPGRSDVRVEWRRADFDAADTYERLVGDAIDAVFCCLGTTIKQAGSQEAFRRVDYEYPMRTARALRGRAGGVRFALVSAVGASIDSSVFYLRTKGELERDLGTLGFLSLDIFRPSLLLGAREGTRAGEAFSIALMRPLGALMVGPLAKYHPIHGSIVAGALIGGVYRQPPTPVSVHFYPEMLRLSVRPPERR
jgi:uncharacterized protein YbjT (DUF2867 family)